MNFLNDKKDLYLILTTGNDGTPMKSYNHLDDKERWDLASYIESRIKKEIHKPAEYEIDLKTHIIDEEIKKLKPFFNIQQVIDLHPYDKDHAMIIAKSLI